MRGFRQHLTQVSASGDLERGLDGDLHFDANLNRHAKITGRAYGLYGGCVKSKSVLFMFVMGSQLNSGFNL